MASTLALPPGISSPRTETAAFEALPPMSDASVLVNRTYRSKWSTLYTTRVVLQSIILIPVRLALTVILVIIAFSLAALGTACMSRADGERPLALWRRIVLWPVRRLMRIELAVLGYHWVHKRGTEANKRDAPIVVSNHISFVEPWLLMAIMGGTPLSATENANGPVGVIFRALQAMLVDRDRSERSSAATGGAAVAAAAGSSAASAAGARGSGSAALLASAASPGGGSPVLTGMGATATAPAVRHGGDATTMPTLDIESGSPALAGNGSSSVVSPIPGATATGSSGVGRAGRDINDTIRARALDLAFPRVLIFPEGTTTTGHALLSFKPGAFRPGLPVQPVVIRYPHSHMDPSWVSDGPGMGGLVLRHLLQLHNRVEVSYLPPYTPSPEERADAVLFATNVRRVMATALRVPTTEFNYEDIQLGLTARAHNYPVPFAVIEVMNIRQAFPRFDIRRARAYLSLFIAQDAAMTGRIDFAQFKAFLTSIPTAGPGGVPGGASAIVKAISASARSRASSGPSPHSGSDAGSSSSSGTPASASSASASATFTGTPASAASAAGSGSGSGSGAVLPHLARESLLEGLFAYLDKRGYGTLAFRDVFVGVAVLRGLGAGHARDLARLLFLALDGSKRGSLDKAQLETLMAAVWPAASRSDVDSMLRAVLAVPAGADAAGSAAAAGDGAVPDGAHAAAAFPAFADWFVARDGAMAAVQTALLGGDDDSHLLPVSKRSA